MSRKEAREMLAFIAQLVKAKRSIKRMTTRDLGRLLGTNSSQIWRIEHAKDMEANLFLRLVDWLRT